MARSSDVVASAVVVPDDEEETGLEIRGTIEIVDVWKGEPPEQIELNLEQDSCDGWDWPVDDEEFIVYLDFENGSWDINDTAVGEEVQEHQAILDRRYPSCAASPGVGWRGVAALLSIPLLRRRRRV